MTFTSAQKPPDQTRIVAFLAKESHQPVAEVAKLYEHERAELASDAHITKFLHIFAIRNVQEALRKQALDKKQIPTGSHPTLTV
jgi:hypothetical protein